MSPEVLDRRTSLSLLAEALDKLLSADPNGEEAFLECLPANLHADAVDVLTNVMHFVADADIRAREASYGEAQRAQMRKLIEALRLGESRARLLEFSFLSF
jgi:hypothetical protein